MVKRLFGLTVVVILVGLVGVYVLSARQTASKTAAGAQTAAAAAVDTSKMPLVNINVVQIKPELVDEWMDFQKSETIPALQKAGVKARTAVTTVIGPSFEYVFLTRPANFAARDGDNPIVKALGQDGARAYAQKNRHFIASQRTFVARLRTDLSYQPDPSAPLPVAVVSNYTITSGHGTDFETYIKNDVTPAHKQLKTGGFLVYQDLFGGEANMFVVATLMRNFSELDNGPAVTRAYGAAKAAAIQQKLAGFVTHVERTVSRQVPELSFQPKMVTENR
jgi:hypothetical protein